MADYNSFVLEGIKIIFADNNKEFIKEICEPLINIYASKSIILLPEFIIMMMLMSKLSYLKMH